MFLTDNDYKTYISDNDINIITDEDTEIRLQAENTAKAKIEQYLNARYDTIAMFSATETDRNPLLIEYMIDIVIYTIISRLPGRMGVDELRTERYNYVIRELEKIARGTLNPSFPLLAEANKTGFVSWGSNKKLKYY